MKEYSDLELTILSCLLQKPELMKELTLEDKYFKKYNKLLIFMKAFYKKFGNFDLVLMATISKNKNKIMEYIELLVYKEPAPSNFKKYQERLIEMYNENEKERYIIGRIYELANDLFVKNITVEEFKNKSDEIFENINKIFKDGEY